MESFESNHPYSTTTPALRDIRRLLLKPHKFVSCNNCEKQDFIDYRYKCFVCFNYDLCGDCFEKRKFSDTHEVNHPMVLVPGPDDSQNPYYSINEILGFEIELVKTQFKDEVFLDTTCKFCQISPITGPCLRCDDCHQLNVCLSCYEQNKTVDLHDKSHALIIEFLAPRMKLELDHIRIKETIRDNESSKVYLVNHQPLNKLMCMKKIKILDKERAESIYKNETIIYSEIHSRHILPVIATKFDDSDGHVYILQDYMKHRSLDHFYSKNKEEVSYRRKFDWIRQICKAIRRIHQKGYIHKDIKPQKILIDEVFNAKIGYLDHSEYTTQSENNNNPDLLFSSIEMSNKKEFTNKTDIFSFGLLINYIFTSKLHTKDENRNFKFEEESNIFFELVFRCIDSDPEKRPSAREIEEGLDQFSRRFWRFVNLTRRQYDALSINEKNDKFIEFYKDFSKSDSALKKLYAKNLINL